MAELDPKKVHRNLKSKGFRKARNKATDHHWLEFYHEGRFVTYTRVSHGSKKGIHKHLISQMACQCKLTRKQFLDLANCPMSKEKYIEILRENGYLD